MFFFFLEGAIYYIFLGSASPGVATAQSPASRANGAERRIDRNDFRIGAIPLPFSIYLRSAAWRGVAGVLGIRSVAAAPFSSSVLAWLWRRFAPAFSDALALASLLLTFGFPPLLRPRSRSRPLRWRRFPRHWRSRCRLLVLLPAGATSFEFATDSQRLVAIMSLLKPFDKVYRAHS